MPELKQSPQSKFSACLKNNQFALVPVDTFYEPKYIDGKSHWYAISREDGDPVTVAAIYDDAIIEGEKVRSFQCSRLMQISIPL